MRIAVIGAGGVGGAFGAALAKGGSDVTFLARGAHLAAMRERGLKVLGPRGDIHLEPTQTTDDPAAIGPVDVVLFCVKLWDVESAGAAIRPLIGKATAVIPLQNGIDASERLVPILGKDAVMGGVAQISATIAEPGVIRQTGTFMRLLFGELDGKPSARGAAFHAACQAAGFDSVNTDEIVVELWNKFVLLATNSSVVSLTRLPFGKLRDDPEVFGLFEKCIAEVAAVGRARGVKLAGDLEEKLLKATRGFPPEMMPSMAVDLLRGNKLELPWLAGKVVALGRELKVPTPTYDVMYAALKPYANGKPA
jgi:2-dehydropantoate 2-reductase